jgi:putative membrane protein
MSTVPAALQPRRREPGWLLAGVGLVLAFTGLMPASGHQIWFLETFPVMIGIALLVPTYRVFPFTPLAYRLLALHGLVLIWGGYYTYADNPLFEWLQHALDLERNYYDRLGHLLQGFVPAIVAREILLRRSPLRPGKWLFFIVACICLAISACYEFIEWWVALLTGEEAEVFLATQGDIWDTQWDMFLALIGAIAAQLALARLHDREIARLPGGGRTEG